MKFLVDESTGVGVSRFLNQKKHDSISVTEESPGRSDEQILLQAEKQGRVVVTNDKDFGDLIFYQKLNTHGIILLRLKDESGGSWG